MCFGSIIGRCRVARFWLARNGSVHFGRCRRWYELRSWGRVRRLKIPNYANNSIGGRNLEVRSPFSSIHFLIASVTCLVCVLLDIYLIFRHWIALTPNAVLMLSMVIGIQLIGLWWRAFRHCVSIERLLLETGKDVVRTPALDAVLRASVRGTTDILIWSYLTNLATLLYLSGLLSRLDGMK
jgi:hypothetical protein